VTTNLAGCGGIGMKEAMALWRVVCGAVLRAMMGSRAWAVAGCGGFKFQRLDSV
jgi:hypothetical protein